MEQIIAKFLQDFEQGKMNRRQLIQSLAFLATAGAAASARPAAAAENKVLKAINLNHISYTVADYAKTRDWYAELFGMKILEDNHKGRAVLGVGESHMDVRTGPSAPLVDHICFTIADWEKIRGCPEPGGCAYVKPEDWTPEVVEKIQKRFTVDEWKNTKGGVGEDLKRRNIKFKSANQVSFHILDPDGFEVQIG